MKAVLTITFEPEQEEGEPEAGRMHMEAKWSDGSGPRGKLTPSQSLLLLEQARLFILAQIRLDPPSSIVQAPASALGLKPLELAGTKRH